VNILTGQFGFPSHVGSGPVVQNFVVRDVANVAHAVAFITGFDISYANNDDHHLGRLVINVVVVAINGPLVTVQGTFGLRDWSGNWDDPYQGTVNFAVITYP
jgi:hypothetical protein